MRDIVDPYLADRGVLVRESPVLKTSDARAAHVYLSLQLRDDAQDKGLTRLSFDGLVRSALTNTDPEHRLSRADITKRIQGLLPGDLPARLDELTNGALALTTCRAQPPMIRPASPRNDGCEGWRSHSWRRHLSHFSKATLAGPATGFFAAPQWMRSLLTVPRNCSGENGFCRNSTSPGTISSVKSRPRRCNSGRL